MLLRIAAGLLPGFLLAACIALLVVSPLSWGAANHADLPGWLPPLIGVVFAIPTVLLGYGTLRAVGHKTRDAALAHALPLAFGAVFMFGGTMIVCGLVVSLPDPATYDALLAPTAVSPDVPVSVAAAQRGVQVQQEISSAGLLAISSLLGAIMFAWIWAASYAYTTAFQADPLMKFEAAQMHRGDALEMLLHGERRRMGMR